MTSFVGRTHELAVLESAYRAPSSQFIPIYGRRRVGKSELILQFLNRKRGLYFLGKRGPAALLIKEFLKEAARAFRQPLLASLDVQDWKQALTLALEQGPRARKLVLVFDEFQWIAAASPELPSVLQELWDLHWSRSKSMMVILCGSYMGFMEKEVLGRQSPLFGRRTAQILLKPLPFREAADFHPGWSLRERARAYFLCGGVPFYLKLFPPSASIEVSIQKQILEEYGALQREPDFLLREELREIEKYQGILMALSEGTRAAKDIARFTGMAERNIHYYVQHLSELGYVARRSPLTHRKPNVRDVRYSLEDPLLRFWFRFVYPDASFISQVGPERAFQELIRPRLESYFGACFERLCREALPLIYEEEGVLSAYEIGEYWDRSVQIDVVGLRRDGWIDLGECKWGTVRSLNEVVEELKTRADHYPRGAGSTVQQRIFVADAPRLGRRPEGIRIHNLAEIYGRRG